MSNRFRWLTEDSGPSVALWDVDLTENLPFATVPSRGSIVDGWLLTLPRFAAINIAALTRDERRALMEQARYTAAAVSDGFRQTTFFEHGPVRSGTPTGCGVDHAHLHSVPLSFDLLALLPADMGWRQMGAVDPWMTLGARDYLLVGRDDTWMACEPEVPVSQFFRRQIAEVETAGYGWNHNEHPWTDNIRRTIDCFAANRQTAAYQTSRRA